MTKAELIEKAESYGLGDLVSMKMTVAEIEEVISFHEEIGEVTPSVLDKDQAAAYLGITPEELMRTFYQGLPPGSLGFKDNRVLVWRRDDLLPAPQET